MPFFFFFPARRTILPPSSIPKLAGTFPSPEDARSSQKNPVANAAPTCLLHFFLSRNGRFCFFSGRNVRFLFFFSVVIARSWQGPHPGLFLRENRAKGFFFSASDSPLPASLARFREASAPGVLPGFRDFFMECDADKSSFPLRAHSRDAPSPGSVQIIRLALFSFPWPKSPLLFSF